MPDEATRPPSKSEACAFPSPERSSRVPGKEHPLRV